MTDELSSERTPKPAMPVALRIFLYIIAILIGIGIFQVPAYMLAGYSPGEIAKATEAVSPTQVLISFWGLVPLFLFTWIFRRYIDDQRFSSLGLAIKGRGRDLLLGLGVAIVLYAIGSLVLGLTGNIQFEKMGISTQTLLLNFGLFITVAIMEELMVRGYILNNLLSVMNKYLALAISAVIFAAMHGLNSGITWLAMLNLFLAGVLLGCTYIFTKNLWFAMSLHLFWNFIQGPLLGYKVSGQVTESFLSAKPLGNPLLSGGDFGFEGSVVCTILCAALALVIILYYEKIQAKIIS